MLTLKKHLTGSIFKTQFTMLNVKRPMLFFCSAVILAGGFSCKKLAASLFGGQSIVLPAYTITVPEIPFSDSTIQFNSGSFTTYVNTDSLVRAQTGGSYNINDVSSIKVSNIALTVTNADASNNLSALKRLSVTIASSTNTTAGNMFSINIPAYTYFAFSTSPSDAANIVDYLHGTTVVNVVYGNIRKTTAKALILKAVVTLYAK